MSDFYNDIDPFACEWTRQLIEAGHIPAGDVDEKSIKGIVAADLVGRRRCHFFNGIAGWAAALELAGFPESRSVWTGSAPCQPYSAAGKQRGNADERNLWPDLFRLIAACKPSVVFGEQVGSALVVGRSAASREDLQEVRDREAVFGVLRQLQGESPGPLREVFAEGQGLQAGEQGQDGGGAQTLAGNAAGLCVDERGEAQGQGQGDGVRHRPAKHPEPDRRGSLRVDRDTVQLDDAAGVERTVAGPDRLEAGVHDGQRAGGSLLAERDGEHMGAGEDFGDCVGDHGPATESLERLLRSTWAVTPEALEPVWFDRVRGDLEAAGYAVRACVLGAHSVGGPHIRQRLYWVASRPVADAEVHRLGQRAAVAGRGREGVRPQGDGGRLADDGNACGLADADGWRRGERSECHGDTAQPEQQAPQRDDLGRCGRLGFWDAYALIPCRDGKSRRVPAEVESGFQFVASGFSAGVDGVRTPCRGRHPLTTAKIEGRAGLLKGAGNAICVPTAAAFVRAFLDSEGA